MCNPSTNPTSTTEHNNDHSTTKHNKYTMKPITSVVVKYDNGGRNGGNGNDNGDDDNSSSGFASVLECAFFGHGSEVVKESGLLFSLAFPILLTNLILYSRSMLSMVFLGRIGEDELAAGSLAIAFANITGYSVFSGLALGMEPLCSQAFGARRPKLLSLTLQRCVLFLLVCSLPLGFLWLNMETIMRVLQQDPNISKLARVYITFCLPDLFTNSFYHPIKIYLRAQGITRPVTLASLVGAICHVPIMLFLVGHLGLGMSGVAIANSASNLVSLLVLVMQVWVSGLHIPTWSPPTLECLTGWWPLICLAAPSCVSVCLEWWWYEIMIVLCGMLGNPRASVASMGVLIQTTGLIYNFPAALSNAVSARVGFELGANQPKRARLVGKVGIVWAAVIGFAAMMFAFGARNKWAQMFTKDAEILSLTAAALPILGLCELGNCPQTVACGVVRGTARPTTAANVNLGAFYMVGTPIAIGLAFFTRYGFCGLWFGLLAAQICCAGSLLLIVGTTDWDDEAKRARMLSHCDGVDPTLLLPEGEVDGDGGGDDDYPNIVNEDDPLISILVT